MPTSPSELLEHASRLAANASGDEAAIRAAISRAYYASYHDCKLWYDQLPCGGRAPEGGASGMHLEFANLLQNPDPSLSASLREASKLRGIALRRLHGDRVSADYRMKKQLFGLEARNAIANAKKIALLI